MRREKSRYTDEETRWLVFVDKFRTKENQGRPPTLTQTLVLAKKFLRKESIMAYGAKKGAGKGRGMEGGGGRNRNTGGCSKGGSGGGKGGGRGKGTGRKG